MTNMATEITDYKAAFSELWTKYCDQEIAMATPANCPKCHNPLTCAHCVGAKGGAKSKRVITKAQQAKMQEARGMKAEPWAKCPYGHEWGADNERTRDCDTCRADTYSRCIQASKEVRK